MPVICSQWDEACVARGECRWRYQGRRVTSTLFMDISTGLHTYDNWYVHVTLSSSQGFGWLHHLDWSSLDLFWSSKNVRICWFRSARNHHKLLILLIDINIILCTSTYLKVFEIYVFCSSKNVRICWLWGCRNQHKLLILLIDINFTLCTSTYLKVYEIYVFLSSKNVRICWFKGARN